jgi:hypothetical protein
MYLRNMVWVRYIIVNALRKGNNKYNNNNNNNNNKDNNNLRKFYPFTDLWERSVHSEAN